MDLRDELKAIDRHLATQPLLETIRRNTAWSRTKREAERKMIDLVLASEVYAILEFLKRYLKKKKMLHALGVVNNGQIEDVRGIIDGYRELYQREGR